ncbi:MAG: ketoacyl-ACP synthase III, partial [Bacteroidota bacterium]
MFINAIDHYYPEQVIPNAYFQNINGMTEEWMESRTGIRERRKAGPDENTETMALAATQRAWQKLPYPVEDLGLIVAATYSPHDTVATLGHVIQHDLPVGEVPVVTITSACSSLLNALEIVQGYFAMGKAETALVVVSDHNTRFANEEDTKAGHLWGDGAAALFVSQARKADSDFQILDILTGGAAHVGKNLEGVKLIPDGPGILMPNGRDVFIHATQYMSKISQQIVERNGKQLEDLSWLIPHQANFRISKKVAEDLGLPLDKVVSNIQYLGNTGCAGCGIAFSEHQDHIQPG